MTATQPVTAVRPPCDPRYNASTDLTSFGPRFKWLDMPDGFTLAESNASSTEVRA